MLPSTDGEVHFLFLLDCQNSGITESATGELPGTEEAAGSGLLREFLKTANFDVDERNVNGIVLSSLLRSLSSHPSVFITGYVDLKSGYGYGLFEINPIYVQMSRRRNESGEVSHCELIIADNSNEDGNKRMAVLSAESVGSELVEMDCSEMRENVIIDLNEGGCRWEGGELNGKPFGFGREYSENDNLVYEGFVFEGKKVCVGKEWNDNSNNNCLVYEGGYCNDERWGKGISYDLTGNVDFEGEWINNHGISENGEDLMNDLVVPMSIEEFVIGNEDDEDDEDEISENITSLHFSPLLVRLKRIKIGKECFKHVRVFVIDGLESLESVEIGREYLRSLDDIEYLLDMLDYEIRNENNLEEERNAGLCRITNCPNLRQLKIGNWSFWDFKSFELSNLNSIQSIKFGHWCFYYAEGFSLKGE